MLEHPITGVLLIVGGTFGFTILASKSTDGQTFSDITNFRGYTSSLGFIIIGNLILLNSSNLLAATTLFLCSIGVLTFGVITKRIGTNSQMHKPKLLIFTLVGITLSVALFLASFQK